MQALMLLPSLVMSLVWAMRTRDFTIAFMTVASSILAVALLKRRSLKTSNSPLQVSLRRGRVFLGNRRLPRSSLLWRPSWRKTVLEQLRELPDLATGKSLLNIAASRRLAAQSRGTLMTWLGLTQSQDFEHDLLGDCPHLFVVGPTGSGKSQLLRTLLVSLTSRYVPSQLLLFVADFKGSSLVQKLDLGSHEFQLIDDLMVHEQSDFWNSLLNFIKGRESQAKALGRAEFEPSAFGSPLVVVVVDEVAAACRSSTLAQEVISTVAARGRSLGIALVAANQGIAGVPRDLLLNLRTRIALAGTDQVELVQLGGNGTKLKQSQSGWVSARAISHAQDDCDFSYPLGLT